MENILDTIINRLNEKYGDREITKNEAWQQIKFFRLDKQLGKSIKEAQ